MKLKLIMGLASIAVAGSLAMVITAGPDARAQATGTRPQEKKPNQDKAAPAPVTAAIERGRYIATASDRVACHMAPRSRTPFVGGYALETPFGKLIASNITMDGETGIGNWTEAQFTRAVRKGKGKHGENLYPAMPYTAYAKLSDADMHDLWLYMRTVKPVRNKVDSNQLPFPFNIRLLMAGWNLLFFEDTPFKPDTTKSLAWNRGAYLIQGAGHCASCHTGKNFLGGDKSGALQGGTLANWYAPEITGNAYTGVGSWSTEQIVQYLKIGSNDVAVAAGPMAKPWPIRRST